MMYLYLYLCQKPKPKPVPIPWPCRTSVSHCGCARRSGQGGRRSKSQGASPFNSRRPGAGNPLCLDETPRGGEVRHGLTSGISCETSLNEHTRHLTSTGITLRQVWQRRFRRWEDIQVPNPPRGDDTPERIWLRGLDLRNLARHWRALGGWAGKREPENRDLEMYKFIILDI